MTINFNAAQVLDSKKAASRASVQSGIGVHIRDNLCYDLIQSSSRKASIRLNSRVLCVTRMTSSAAA